MYLIVLKRKYYHPNLQSCEDGLGDISAIRKFLLEIRLKLCKDLTDIGVW